MSNFGTLPREIFERPELKKWLKIYRLENLK